MTKKKNKSVISLCIQEPSEDGSTMNLGAISGDELRFIHQAFITDTIANGLDVADADFRVYYIDEDERARLVKIVEEYLKKKTTGRKATALNTGFSTHPLKRERWGVRIEHVFDDCFAQGYDKVLVIGSRTPTFTGKMIKTAMRMLEKSDAVFGPTPEGRYYTIGMSSKHHINLSQFDWKSKTIYSEVAATFTEKQLSWSELEIWYTVESSDELEMMARDINQYRFEGDETTAKETEAVVERLISKLGI